MLVPTGLAAVLEVPLLDGVGLEPAVPAALPGPAAAVRFPGALLTALSVLVGPPSVLILSLHPLTAPFWPPLSAVASAAAGLLASTLPALPGPGRTARLAAVAPLAAVESVEPAAVVAAAVAPRPSPFRLSIPVVPLAAIARVLVASIPCSVPIASVVSVISVVHGSEVDVNRRRWIASRFAPVGRRVRAYCRPVAVLGADRR